MKTPSHQELVNCIQVSMWLKLVFPEFSEFEKVECKFLKGRKN